MGKTRYNIIKELLMPIVGKTIHMNKLWRRIMIDVGSDSRTIREYMNTMISLGMISEVRENHYKIISNEADI
jgi:predicted transcriptional regulator